MFERFSDEGTDLVVRAQHEAAALGHDWLGTEHLLLALADRGPAPVAAAFQALGLTRERIRGDVVGEVGPGERPGGRALDPDALATIGVDFQEVKRRIEQAFGPGALEGTRAWRQRACFRFSPKTKKVLEVAFREALRLGESRARPEHVVLAMVRVQDCLAAQVLARRVPLGRLRMEVVSRIRRSA